MRPCDVMVNLKNWNFERDPKYPLTKAEAEAIMVALKEYKQKVTYRVERATDEEPDAYYMWGVYDDFDKAQKAMKELNACSGVVDARIVKEYK